MAASMASVIEALTQTAAAQQRIQLEKKENEKNSQNQNSSSKNDENPKDTNNSSINALTNALNPPRNESPVASQASALLNSLATSVGQPITMPSPPTTTNLLMQAGIPTSLSNSSNIMQSNLNSLLQSQNHQNQQSNLQTTLQNLTNQINQSNQNSPPSNSAQNGGQNPNLSPADFKRPPHTYPSLIAQAILDSPNNLITLRGIYDYIMEKYPYYKYCHDKSAWQNSIRHNLSLNQCFIKGKYRGFSIF